MNARPIDVVVVSLLDQLILKGVVLVCKKSGQNTGCFIRIVPWKLCIL